MMNFLSRVFTAIVESRMREAERRVAMYQLSSMTDRELKDMGVTRGELKQVVTQGR
jgi:uncharacterized protein YjiS (DUF1127 family)